MARRFTSPSVEQLTRAELEALRVKLEAMPRHELETFYKATHNACRNALRLPSPRLIQELVQAWRALRTRARLTARERVLSERPSVSPFRVPRALPRH